jgi:hypothetical protein
LETSGFAAHSSALMFSPRVKPGSGAAVSTGFSAVFAGSAGASPPATRAAMAASA